MKKIVSFMLVVTLFLTVLLVNPTESYAYGKTAAATNDYTTWKQTSSTWGDATPWPNASIPKFGDAGCWITSVAILLRHYNVVTDSNVNTFNPLICNNRLMQYGIVNSAGDFQNLGKMNSAYPGFSYVGTKSYSFSNVKSLYDSGYAIIIHETRGHYVAVRSVSGSTITVMDPGYNTTSLTNSDEIQYYKPTSKNNSSINLTVKQTSSSSIRSDWKAVSGADQYFVEVKDSNGNRLDKVWTKELGWDFYNLTPNKTYTVRLDVLKNGKSLGEISKSIYLTGNTDNTAKGSQTISEGDYRIISYLDPSKSVDVSGASKKNCANVQLWQNKDNAAQIWHIKYLGDGYYSMEDKNSGRYLDVQNGDTKSGTNVWIYDGNGSDAQKWVIRETGDGWYNIVSKRSGLNLDVYGGQKTNGTNIQIYSDNGSGAQKWGFVAYGKSIGKTVSNGYYQMGTMLDTSKLIDVSGAGKNNSTNVQLWQKTSKAAQTWKISYLGDGYYSIMDVNSGKYLDVAGGRKLVNTNVQIYQKNNTDSQKWIIKSEGSGRYSIISKVSGHYLDCDGAKSANGTNLKTWYKFKNGNNAQLWKFTRVYNLSKPKVNTPTSPKKKQMKATWKKVTGAKGYVVQFSTSKSFSKVAKSITTSSLTAKYTSATRGKYYYVRVRAYTKTGLGNKIYSSWSAVSKRVKCK